MTASVAAGGCLCGAVRFRVAGALRDVVVCHCSLCRRAGTGAAAYTSADCDAIVFDRDDGLSWYRDANERSRGFCRECGSSLFWRTESSTAISVSAGALDEPTGLQLGRHIHVSTRGGWEPIPTDAPAHEAGSGSPLVGTPE